MCGIAGIMIPAGQPPNVSLSLIETLYKSIEWRGKHATGYGTLLGNKLYVYKNGVDFKEWWPGFKDKWESNEIPIGNIILLHTRQATIGAASDNSNNHPIGVMNTGKSFGALTIHNGTLGGYEEAYKLLNIVPTAEVDSAIIPTVLATLGIKKGVQFILDHLKGSAASASITVDGDLLLTKDSRPLYLGYIDPGWLVWSSDSKVINEVSSFGRFGMSFSPTLEMKEGSFLHFSRDLTLQTNGKFVLPTIPHTPVSHVAQFINYAAEHNPLPVHYRPTEEYLLRDLVCRLQGCIARCAGTIKIVNNWGLVCTKHKEKISASPSKYTIDAVGIITKLK